MKRARVLLVSGLLLLVVGALVVGAWNHFFDPGGALLEPFRGAGPADGDDADADGPTIVPPIEGPRPRARGWPFGEWEDEFVALRREEEPEGFVSGRQLAVDVVTILDRERFDISMKDAEFATVLDFLAERMEPFGVAVYTREPMFGEIVAYNLDMRDVLVIDVVQEMHKQSRKRLRWHVSQLGFCIGSWAACEKDKLERDLIEGRRRAKFDAKTPLLQIEYRPDFDGAHVGDIVRDITEKTGVEVIVDQTTWDNAQPIHWRTGPQPLSLVLGEVSKSVHAVMRVKDGRVFLISP